MTIKSHFLINIPAKLQADSNGNQKATTKQHRNSATANSIVQ